MDASSSNALRTVAFWLLARVLRFNRFLSLVKEIGIDLVEVTQ